VQLFQQTMQGAVVLIIALTWIFSPAMIWHKHSGVLCARRMLLLEWHVCPDVGAVRRQGGGRSDQCLEQTLHCLPALWRLHMWSG